MFWALSPAVTLDNNEATKVVTRSYMPQIEGSTAAIGALIILGVVGSCLGLLHFQQAQKLSTVVWTKVGLLNGITLFLGMTTYKALNIVKDPDKENRKIRSISIAALTATVVLVAMAAITITGFLTLHDIIPAQRMVLGTTVACGVMAGIGTLYFAIQARSFKNRDHDNLLNLVEEVENGQSLLPLKKNEEVTSEPGITTKSVMTISALTIAALVSAIFGILALHNIQIRQLPPTLWIQMGALAAIGLSLAAAYSIWIPSKSYVRELDLNRKESEEVDHYLTYQKYNHTRNFKLLIITIALLAYPITLGSFAVRGIIPMGNTLWMTSVASTAITLGGVAISVYALRAEYLAIKKPDDRHAASIDDGAEF